jgi:hypothetical protein
VKRQRNPSQLTTIAIDVNGAVRGHVPLFLLRGNDAGDADLATVI